MISVAMKQKRSGIAPLITCSACCGLTGAAHVQISEEAATVTCLLPVIKLCYICAQELSFGLTAALSEVSVGA